ncbi:NUDIX domain-containing protein [Brevibacillus brevis]|uniref:NUDIX domain-containing protein n=1 Tax=Brevibacillus brevis TaxID=1393 RepID=UPI003B0055D8
MCLSKEKPCRLEKNTWSIPGGKVDPYEQLETSVVREIKEEVNLDVEVKFLLCTAETPKPEPFMKCKTDSCPWGLSVFLKKKITALF